MPVTPIQTSFAKGEVSKHLRGQVGSSLFQEGLSRCENFIPLPHGPLLMRPGSVDCGSLGNDTGIRFIRQRMADEQDFLLVLTDGSLEIYDVSTGRKTIVTARDVSTNGDFSQGTSGWIERVVPGGAYQVNGDLEIAFGECVLTTPYFVGDPVVPQYIYSHQLRQEITTDAAYSGHVYVKVNSLQGGEFHLDHNTYAIGFRVLVETGDGTGLLATADYDRANPPAGGLMDIPFTMPGGTTTLNVNFYLRSGGAYLQDQPVESCRCEIDDIAVVVSRVSGFEITTPWTAAQLSEIQWDTETAQDHTVFVHPAVHPWSFRYDSRGGGFWSWAEVPFVEPPIEWGAGGWPSACQFHDGRLYLSVRNRLWGSRVGSPFDFRYRTDADGNPTNVVSATTYVTPECAIERKLATKGVIRFIQSGRVLLVGTDISVHSVTAQSALSPTDFHARPESGYGAAKKMAVDAGNFALYISADRKDIYAIGYSQESDGWNAKAVTFIGGAIDVTDRIKEIHYTKGLAFALLDAGRFAACAFLPEENAIGWFRLPIAGTGANVLTAAVSDGPNGKFLWMAVQRATGIRLERIQFSETNEDLAYVDGAVVLDVTVAGGATYGAVPGLAHLEGEEVVITVGGYYDSVKTVAAGSVTLDNPIEGPATVRVKVGVMPTYQANLLPRNSKTGKVHHPTIGVHLNDSALPLLNGKRPKDRSPGTPYDTPEPRRTGSAEIDNLGWDKEGSLTISQDLPFRTEVLALYTVSEKGEI